MTFAIPATVYNKIQFYFYFFSYLPTKFFKKKIRKSMNQIGVALSLVPVKLFALHLIVLHIGLAHIQTLMVMVKYAQSYYFF